MSFAFWRICFCPILLLLHIHIFVQSQKQMKRIFQPIDPSNPRKNGIELPLKMVDSLSKERIKTTDNGHCKHLFHPIHSCYIPCTFTFCHDSFSTFPPFPPHNFIISPDHFTPHLFLSYYSPLLLPSIPFALAVSPLFLALLSPHLSLCHTNDDYD